MLYKPSTVTVSNTTNDETISELLETIEYLKNKISELEAEVRMLKFVNFSSNFK